MKWGYRILPLLWALWLCSACFYQQQRAQTWYADEQRDSLEFALTHHYSVGYNFVVQRDSLELYTEIPSRAQLLTIVPNNVSVYRKDELIVAELQVVPEDAEDSIWVKVARDQETMGWVRETTLLPAVSPDDPISIAIYEFSEHHVLVTAVLVLFVLWVFGAQVLWLYRQGVLQTPLRLSARSYLSLFRRYRLASVYPTLLYLTMGGSAVFYASMQLFVPQTWTEFYYHPTLNPFAVPPLLGGFLFSVWVILLFLIATVDESFRQLSVGRALVYLLRLCANLAVLYLAFSLTTLIYIGYLLYVVFLVFAIYYYIRYVRARYRCGHCGMPLHDKGVCPRCGAYNQ